MCTAQIVVIHPSPISRIEASSQLKADAREWFMKNRQFTLLEGWLDQICWLYAGESADEARTAMDRLNREVPIILYTDRCRDLWLSFLSTGVRAWISARDHKELPQAILAVKIGGLYFSKEYLSRVGEILFWHHPDDAEEHFSLLTPMEKRIVQEIARDRSNREIAELLHVSERTVEHHVSTALRKMGVKSRVGLVVKTMKSNLNKYYINSKFEENTD